MRRAGRAHSSPAGANPQSCCALPPSLVSSQAVSAPGAAAAPAPDASFCSTTPEQLRPPRRSSKESPPASSGGATSERHEALRWVVEQEERSNRANGGQPLRPTPIPLSPPHSPHLATHPPSDTSSHLFAPPPAAARALLPPAAVPPAASPTAAAPQHESPPPYPYSLLQELQSQQQPGHDVGVQMPLVGFLWKRGTSWRSFAYQRRFFYLTEDALCYRQRPLPGDQGAPPGLPAGANHLALAQADNCAAAGVAKPGGGAGSGGRGGVGAAGAATGEKRIPLTSVTCVRMHSKLKYEFELICTSRSYRLRAPSAQALALWVTAISSEWLQLRSPPTIRNATGAQQARSAPNLLLRGSQHFPPSDWDLSAGSGGHSLSSHNTLSSSISSCNSLSSSSSQGGGSYRAVFGSARHGMPPHHHYYRPSQQQLHAPAPASKNDTSLSDRVR